MAVINIEKMAQNVAQRAMQELRDNGVFVSRWIPVKFRELMEEEKERFRDECDKAFDCPLPDDGQEVLVSTKWGVDKDTFCIDGYGVYFENYDADDLLAWMPLPEPYKEAAGHDKSQ